MNNEERLKYYFGSYFNKKINVKVEEQYKTFNLNQVYFWPADNSPPKEFPHNLGMYSPYFWWSEENFNINIKSFVVSGDGYLNNNLPVLMKARLISSENKGILLKLEHTRHWSIIYKAQIKEVLWKDKKSEPIWRGNHISGIFKKPNRRMLVEKYFDSFNFKFWPLTRDEEDYHKNEIFFDKREILIEEQLKYKYLISMEGNDVSTGLKWMLKSNSLVLMPPPKVESWLMEGLLVPWQHYVPLDDSLEDVKEKIDWCKRNEEICQNIIKNANSFMSIFNNIENEKLLHKTILQLYKENIKFI